MAHTDEILAAVRGSGCPVADLLSDAELHVLLVTLTKAIAAQGFFLVRAMHASRETGPVN